METKFNARGLAVISVFCAILIGSQFILSFASGVEIVTLLLCCFCMVFGVRYGIITTLAFSLLRCLVFGFVVNVVVLYLVFYTLFAIALGLYGKLFGKVYIATQNNKTPVNRAKIAIIYFGVVALCCVLTVCFTLMDDIITPLVTGLKGGSALAYFYSSLPTMATHTLVVGISVAVLFAPVYKIMSNFKAKARL